MSPYQQFKVRTEISLRKSGLKRLDKTGDLLSDSFLLLCSVLFFLNIINNLKLGTFIPPQTHLYTWQTLTENFWVFTLWGRARIMNYLGRCVGRLLKKGGGHMEEGYLKGNVRAPFTDLKRIRHKELVFSVIQREGTCQFQSNIKNFQTELSKMKEKTGSLEVYKWRLEDQLARNHRLGCLRFLLALTVYESESLLLMINCGTADF